MSSKHKPVNSGPDDNKKCPKGELVWEFKQGRPRVRTWPNGGEVKVHRLASVAWYGFDAVKGKDIHHRVPVSWLNVESNLLPLPKQEHWEITGRQHKRGIREEIVEDVVKGLECYNEEYDSFLSDINIDSIEI